MCTNSWSRIALAACLGSALTGCQVAGPTSIKLGRDRYNNIIHTTSMEQMMANVVRVYHNELPLFMDITEVDATLSFGGSLSGGTTNIGARAGTSGSTIAGEVENVSGTLQYSESPTVRYQPLLGQALVAQMVTPVSVDALGLLYDSYWDLTPLLDFSAAYLTLDYRQFYGALNTISELNHRGAIEVTADQDPGDKEPAEESATPASSPKSGSDTKKSNNNALVIFLRPLAAGNSENQTRVLRLWLRLLRIYTHTQPNADAVASSCSKIGLLPSDNASLASWESDISSHLKKVASQPETALDQVRQCIPDRIVLRVLPENSNHKASAASSAISDMPLLRTYSALGILKNATGHPNPKIEFVTPQVYDQIRQSAWNNEAQNLSYYTLTPDQQDSIDCSPTRLSAGGCDVPLTAPQKADLYPKITKWITSYSDDAHPSGLDSYDQCESFFESECLNLNGLLGTLRRYILVVVSESQPTHPVYVSFYDGERWYYIEKEDRISSSNFQLLSLMMTMMAVPPSTQPLSPVINVGN